MEKSRNFSEINNFIFRNSKLKKKYQNFDNFKNFWFKEDKYQEKVYKTLTESQGKLEKGRGIQCQNFGRHPVIPPLVQISASYLHFWRKNPQLWKFKKIRLLCNIAKIVIIPSKFLKILHSYQQILLISLELSSLHHSNTFRASMIENRKYQILTKFILYISI